MSATASASESRMRQPAREPVFALVGNPNSGKSTIFNALTGLKQKVANYPGVTVEKREGTCFNQHGKRIRLIDLPGTYSLNARSPDEAVVRDVLLGRRTDTPRPDAVILVADASNVERNLYLATQVLELGLPSLLVLNMTDVAEAKQWRIDVEKLSQRLGVPVVPMQATFGKGLLELKAAISRELQKADNKVLPIPPDILEGLQQTRADLVRSGTVAENASLLEPLYLISDHDPAHYGIEDSQVNRLAAAHDDLENKFPGWEDRLAASRYEAVEKLLLGALRRPECDESTTTDRLDSVFLHPVWGGVCMGAIMLGVFYMIFSVAEGPMDWIDQITGLAGGWIESIMPGGDLRDLIVNGVIVGVGGVVKFLPQILLLFFFIGMMEDTGYMARVAFIMDKFMGRVGLNGRSFVPFFSSYACAVPGIMATRTIASPKDRLITILIAPLASCSARLPVYTLMIAAMFPASGVSTLNKALLMLGMYVLGTGGAFAFAWLFNRTMAKGRSSLMVLEMPTYKRPALKHVARYMLERAKLFLVRAGTVILGLSILLWAAKTYPKLSTPEPADAAAKIEYRSSQLSHSIAGRAGHFIEPVIKPLGYDWKIGIGLISSFAAREFFVSTMSIIYAVEGEDIEPLKAKLAADKWPDGRPIFTPLVCLSLMVFYVFAMQCLSTVAVVKRETNGWKWPLFQIVYMTGAAWLASFVVYQGGKLIGF
ncbi:MAG: ferrous iron transport protein B [Verrucomicrobia bacterium]|nr:ferrous iron transport protein B [Verrucomicrobiota bacterium]